MIILGITPSHDAGAAIIEDGKIISAINEERLNRIKCFWGIPKLAIPEAIRIAKIKPSDIDYVAISNLSLTGEEEGDNPKARMINTYLKNKVQFGKKFLYMLSKFPKFVGSKFFSKMCLSVAKIKSSAKVNEIKTYLKQIGVNAEVKQIEHHYAHAVSAYLTSGFKDCLTYTSDFMGDFVCCSVYDCKNGKMKRVLDVPFYHAPGMVYTWITYMLGYTPGKHEGKITGLAAYGDPNKTYDIFKKYMGLSKDKLRYERKLKGFWYLNALKIMNNDLSGFSREDISAGLQKRYEDVYGEHIKKLLELYPHENVALAGGVFANVKTNQKILEIDGVKKVFIHPNMGDGGLAAGAALALYGELNGFKPYKINNVNFGPSFTDEEIENALKKSGLKYHYSNNIAREIAILLNKNKVVARFDGRMEYGPRALGNRSILYNPKDKTVNDWLNERLKRTEFMPFAPVTLEEDIEKSYKNFEGGEHPAKFMTITFGCTDWFAKNCPAVTHVDGTARPQIVNGTENKTYYDIVKEYKKLTGIGTIINTSFNMHEEPIVCTPEEAIRSFKMGHLDYLAISNFLVKRE